MAARVFWWPWILLQLSLLWAATSFTKAGSPLDDEEPCPPNTTPAVLWQTDAMLEEQQQCDTNALDGTFEIVIAPDLTLKVLQDGAGGQLFLQGTEGDATGTVIWGASVCLSRYLANNELEPLRNKRVLELGCGSGLPSLVVAKLAASSSVIATDKEEATLHQLAIVAGLNQIDLQLELLDWKDAKENNDNAEGGTNLQADVILAADVIYSPHTVDPLVQALQKHLAKFDETARAYFALTNTRPGVPHFVQKAMPEAGFDLMQTISCEEYLSLKDVDDSVGTPSRWHGDSSIYVYQRKKKKFEDVM